MINRRKFLLGAAAVSGSLLPMLKAKADVSFGPIIRPARHLTRHWYPNAHRNLIVYSKRTGERRRVIDADDDAELAWHVERLHPGEGHLYLSHAEYDAITNAHDLNDLAARAAGFDKEPDPSIGRHAVVNTAGLVVNVVQADLACGDCGEHQGPRFLLIPHPEVDIGWVYRDGELSAPVEVTA